jgi:hypothetical protein
MTTHPIRLVLAALLLAVPALTAAAAIGSTPSTTTAAEWCVEHDPTYVGDKQVVPASEWCVPGP